MHVWAGISKRGGTDIVIFEGKMNAPLFCQVLESGLYPFLQSKFPDGHRFQQDNDPKHTSRMAKQWMEDHNVNWWHTPPESPDLNPIENLWHELKEYVRRVKKPSNKEELIEAIREFWSRVDVEKCQRYISHLRKVVPRVIEVEGEPTGY